MKYRNNNPLFFRVSSVDNITNDVNCTCDAHPEQDGGPRQAGASTFACYG